MSQYPIIKKCFKCEEVKSISEFYTHKNMHDGHLNKCKECAKKDARMNQKSSSKHSNSYDKTEKGVIRVMYKTQRSNSKRRGHKPPSYTKAELKEWLYKNGFKNLFQKWKDSGYNRWMKPSVDRIDDTKGYSFDNIRLVTAQENLDHAIRDKMHGKGTQGKACKKVECYKDGKLIAEYVSFSDACRSVGYNMERSIKTGKPDKKNGFVWRYK